MHIKNFMIMLMALAVAVIWGCRPATETAGPGGRPGRGSSAVAIVAEPVRQGEIRDERIFTGTLQPLAGYVVAPKVGGRLENLEINIGTALTPGCLIARIDDEEYVQQLAQARAVLEVARATVDQQVTAMQLAEREMERVRSLREKQIASEAEWDRVEAEYRMQVARHKVALAQMEEKASSLKAAEVRLAYTTISAPENLQADRWFVDQRFVDEGAMLAANTPLLSVIDLSELVAVIHVIERDYPLVRVGMPAILETDAYTGQTFSGRIIRLAPALRESSRQARLELAVPNAERLLRPGMFVRVRVEFARRENATLVPTGALAGSEGQEGVFLVDREAQRVKYVPVTVGIRTTEAVEILAPELSGEAATLGRHLLADGAAIVLPGKATVRSDQPGDRRGKDAP
ncbi:MAG: efflux RND transporter periplasmic adaptor subunit [Kiritimatiellia bacterium]